MARKLTPRQMSADDEAEVGGSHGHPGPGLT